METCLNIFKIVIGPSSSRTVGPMRAAYDFATQLKQQETLSLISKIEVELYGALSLSRKCHNVDTALYLGLLGNQPDSVHMETQMAAIKRAETEGVLELYPGVTVKVVIITRQHAHPEHPYAMRFCASDGWFTLYEETWFSVGEGEIRKAGEVTVKTARRQELIPYQFDNADRLLKLCQQNGLSIAALMMKNEIARDPACLLHNEFAKKWAVMKEAVHRGLHTEGLLPGPFKVPRRACALHKSLQMKGSAHDFLTTLS